MMTNLTYPKKCLLLLFCFVAFIVVAYKFTFSDTLRNRSEILQKKEKIAWLKEKEKEIPVLRSKIESLKNACQEDSLSVRDKLTAFISDYAENNDCTVVEIPVSSVYSDNNLKVETNTFTIKGNFRSLLLLESEIEKEFKLKAKVMSAHFFSSKDNQTKRKSLYLTLITQSFNEIEKQKT